MMTCRKFAEILIDFVAGELAPDLQAQVADHLGVCPPCVAYLESYRLTIRLVRQLPNVPMPVECEQRLRAALEAALKE
jgi:anti-sigma factor RsiW